MPRQSDPKGTANRLVAEAILPQLAFKSEEAARLIQGPIDEAVDEFFLSLSGYMGSEEDPTAEWTSSAQRWQPWPALDQDYVKRKGTAAFWLFSLAFRTQVKSTKHLKGSTGVRNAFMAKLNAQHKQPDPLIQYFERKSGLSTFGGAEVTIDRNLTSKEVEPLLAQGFYGPVRTVVGKKTGDIAGRRVRKIKPFQQSFYTQPLNFAALKVVFNVRLWSKFSQASLTHIDETLLASGGLTEKQYVKLRGHVHHRALIRPFMAFYSVVVIPAVIQQVLTAHYSQVKGRAVPTSVKVTTNGRI